MRPSRIVRVCLSVLAASAVGTAGAQSLDPTPETTPPIELDGSIGPGGDVPFDGTTWSIDEGLGEPNDSGSALFYSFGRFGVPGGQIAEFSAENATPDRIFARVTWGEISDIEGTLRSLVPGADLFLMNPAGVRFEGQARLEVQGSFYATTAGRIGFSDGSAFEADASSPPPLLSVAEPTSFGFLPSGGGSVEFGLLELSPLSVPAGETFGAVGGDVQLRGAGRPTFSAPGARIALVAAGPGVEVPFDLPSFDPAAVPAGVPLGEVDVGVGSRVFASNPSGSIVVRGGDFTLSGGSLLLAVHNQAQPTAFPVAVDVAVRDSVRIENAATAIQVGATGAGRGGDLAISGASVEVSQAQLLVATTGGGPGSELRVDAESLRVVNGGSLVSQSRGSGAGGDIHLDVSALELDGAARVSAEANAAGPSGSVYVLADRLRVADGSLVGTSTTGAGAAGDLVIDVEGETLVEGGTSGPAFLLSRASASQANPVVGPGGEIRIDTGSLVLRDGGQVTSSTSGTGDAGLVQVHAGEVEISGRSGLNESGLFAQTLAEGLPTGGRGGTIQVETTGDVTLRDGARIGVETRSGGAAGNVAVDAGGQVLLDAATISARATGTSTAESGSIDIAAARGVRLMRGSSVEARSFGTGPAGSISIDAGPRLELADSSISTESITVSNPGGGRISVTADETVILEDASIDTSVAAGGGDGGDVAIDPNLVVLNRSEIRADALDGNGGNIFIRADQFVFSVGSEVTARSLGGGLEGTVVIESPEADLTPQLAQLTQSYLDAAGLLRTTCGARGGETSSFVVARVAGLPTSPEGYLAAPLWDRVGLGGAAGAAAAPPLSEATASALHASLGGGCTGSEGMR